VVPVSGAIAGAQNEWLLGIPPHVGKEVGLEDGFIEDGDQVNGVGRWAWTVVVRSGFRICDMRLVIGGVEVYTVPARWEENLRTKTVGAVVVRKSIGLWLGRAIVIQTVVADGLRGKGPSIVALEGVASQHAEAFRESMERIIVWTATLAINVSI
jgi:hypothetical protein